MFRLIITLLIISFSLNVFLLSGTKNNNIPVKPPWEPFELSSNLTLESIVNDGYRFGAMPCGQVQFVKTVADTSIQYQVDIDCKDYSKWGKWLSNFLWNKDEALWKRKDINNPYYPFKQNEVSNCYQSINWRVYRFRMDKPDINKIRTFTRNKNCQVLTETEKWDDKSGGSFMVFNSENHLYFKCIISKIKSYEDISEKPEWEFKIISDIPHLDSGKIIEEKERALKLDKYFENKPLDFIGD